jgi:two-component sensor histidine kinase
MALVRSLLALQADAASDSAVRTALGEAEQRIAVMARIYDRLHLAREFDSVPIVGVVDGLVSDLRQTKLPSSCEIVLCVDDSTISTRASISLGIIVNELVTNSIKYGVTTESRCTISVDVHRSGDTVHGSVRDDGAGYPASVLDGRETGYGLTIVHAVASQYGGSVTFANEGGASTGFVLHV